MQLPELFLTEIIILTDMVNLPELEEPVLQVVAFSEEMPIRVHPTLPQDMEPVLINISDTCMVL